MFGVPSTDDVCPYDVTCDATTVADKSKIEQPRIARKITAMFVIRWSPAASFVNSHFIHSNYSSKTVIKRQKTSTNYEQNNKQSAALNKSTHKLHEMAVAHNSDVI